MSLLDAHAALKGRTAIVVGGAIGVGRGVVLALAKAGVEIALCDVDADGVRDIAGEVAALGVGCFARVADVTDADAFDAFYDAVEAAFDGADFLVNVAGGVQRTAFADTTRERNAYEIRLNYGYVLDSTRRALALIRKCGRGGSIVNFTTIEGHRGAAGYAVYAGAKAATTNFSKALAVELGREGIRVNTLVPDATPSAAIQRMGRERMTTSAGAIPDAVRAKGMAMYVPQGAPPSIEDLADGVLFLVSDLSRTVTGTTLHVDGGTNAASGLIRWPYDDSFGPAPQPETLRRLFMNEPRSA